MAWLITLALFLGIGSIICSGIDKANYRAYHQKQITNNQLQAVKGKDVLRVQNTNVQIVHSNDPYDVNTEAEGVRGVLDPIYGPFSMPCACKVDDEKAIAIAKPIWDREVIGTNIVKWDRQTGRIMY